MGIVQVSGRYQKDPSDSQGIFGMVQVKFYQNLKQPVPLEWIKAVPELKTIPLCTQPRLSVMPLLPHGWALICQLAEEGYK